MAMYTCKTIQDGRIYIRSYITSRQTLVRDCSQTIVVTYNIDVQRPRGAVGRASDPCPVDTCQS